MRPILGAALLFLAGVSQAATLGELLQAAWERQERAQEFEARRAEIDARGQAARGLLAGPPVLGISNRNDRLNGDRGKWENEIEIAAPVWLPGQREARKRLTAVEIDEGEAAAADARLALAGTLRALVWQAIAAREEHALLLQRWDTARQLAADVARRVGAGELARTDQLAAQGEALAAEAQAADAAARLDRAMQRLQAVTGHRSLPQPAEEAIGDRSANHPRLVAVRQTLARAQARQRVAEQSDRDPPEIGIQFRRDRDAYGLESRDSVRLAVRIPFATRTRNQPLLAAAGAEIVSATGEQRRTEIEIDADERAAVSVLDNTVRQVDFASRRDALAAERFKLLQRAFALGELGLAELLRAQAATREAALDLARARVEHGLAIARLNQARGILP